MYGMTSAPAEVNQEIIMALRPSGNKSEIAEEGLSSSSGLFGLSGSTK